MPRIPCRPCLRLLSILSRIPPGKPAYGGADLGHAFHQTKQGVRYTLSEPARQEVLACLMRLNHERYQEEKRQDLHVERKASKAKPRKKQVSPMTSG